MLFALAFELQNIMPWVIVALAVIMLVSIVGKCFTIYRNLKRNRTYVKRDDEKDAQQQDTQQQNTHEKDTQDDENV